MLDLKGRRFGRMLVLQRAANTLAGSTTWICRCDCGVEKHVVGRSLRRSRTKSCGCLRREMSTRQFTTHGQTLGKIHTPIYRAWRAMRNRCTNPRNANWPHYGGRGIKVCKRWGDFENFLKDMGQRPSPSYSLDRINNDLGYNPGNCRWATRTEQSRNRRCCMKG